MKNSCADTKVRGGEDVPGVQAGLPAGEHNGAGIHTAAHGKDHTLAGGHALKEL